MTKRKRKPEAVGPAGEQPRRITGITDLAERTGRHRQVVSNAMKHPAAPPGTATAIGPISDAEDSEEYIGGLSKGKRHAEREWRPAPPGPADQAGYVAISDAVTILVAEDLAAKGDRELLDLFGQDTAAARLAVPARTMKTRREMVAKVLGREAARERHGVMTLELRSGTLYYPRSAVIALLREPRLPGRAGWQRRRHEALPLPPPYVPLADRPPVPDPAEALLR